jgi:hypothetical protein
MRITSLALVVSCVISTTLAAQKEIGSQTNTLGAEGKRHNSLQAGAADGDSKAVSHSAAKSENGATVNQSAPYDQSALNHQPIPNRQAALNHQSAAST